MPIGTPVQRFAERIPNASEASTTFSPDSTVAAGTKAILAAGASECYIASVSDSVGNTWTADYHAFPDGSIGVSFASCDVETEITSSDTITMTWSSTRNNNRDVFLMEVSGLAAGAGAFDQSASGSSASPANINIGPTGTLAQEDELALLFVTDLTGGTTITSSPGGWTPATPVADFTSGHLQYQITSATTTLSISSGTFSSPTGWYGAIGTYRGAVEAAARRFGVLDGMWG